MDKKQILMNECTRLAKSNLTQNEKYFLDRIIQNFKFYGTTKTQLLQELWQYLRVLRIGKYQIFM